MIRKPVNELTSNANVIKATDSTSPIRLRFRDGEGKDIDMAGGIEYFYLSKGDGQFVAVTNYDFVNGEMLAYLPTLEKGYYSVEIKDTSGRIFPAGNDIIIQVKESFSSGQEAHYISYKERILDDVEPIILNHLNAHPEQFAGPQGLRGEPFRYKDFTEAQLSDLKNGVVADVWPELENLSKPPIHDPYDSPGSRHLVAGDKQAGFFGFVKPNEMGVFSDGSPFNGKNLALEVGLSAGTLMESDTPLMKFSWNGKILFVPLKPIRHSVSWDDIYQAGAVYGTGSTISTAEQYMLDNDPYYGAAARVTQDAQIDVGALTYKVRLIRGAASDPQNSYNDADRGSVGPENEWNHLILPLHERAPSSFNYKSYVGSSTADWGIGLTDADLRTHHTSGTGSYTWCQEYSDLIEASDNGEQIRRASRGHHGASYLVAVPSSPVHSSRGWRPVLELIQ